VTVLADGSFTYDASASATLAALAEGQTLDDTFTYTISDGHGSTDTGTVVVTVTGNAFPWHNSRFAYDVDDDRFVQPADVLHTVNYINANGSIVLPLPPVAPDAPPPYVDVYRDGWVTPADVLLVINYINRFGAGPIPGSAPAGGGEGEASAFQADWPGTAASVPAAIAPGRPPLVTANTSAAPPMPVPSPPRTERAASPPRDVSEFAAETRLLDLEGALESLAADVAEVWFSTAPK
jgi:hypothetical protein